METASRVVTAETRDHRRVRAKLTVHFRDAQTQADADDAADRCAHLAELLFHEVPGHEHLLGNEQSISATLTTRLPAGLPALRSLDIAALHVLGELGGNTRRRASTLPPPGAAGDIRLPATTPPPSSVTPYSPTATYATPGPPLVSTGRPSSTILPGSMPPASMAPASIPPSIIPPSIIPPGTIPPSALPSAIPPSALPPVSSVLPPGSVPGPPSSVSHRGGPGSVSQRRRSISSSLRNVTASIVPPRGASLAEIGVALSPLLRDATTRLLLGFLRIHDLVTIRRIPLDERATELLAQLLPVSEAPAGEFEASRAQEIARWNGLLGQPVMESLRAEAATLAALLARTALAQVGLMPRLAEEILESLCNAAFPAAEGRIGAAAAVAIATEQELTSDAAHSMARILGYTEVEPLEAALSPLLTSVSDDATLIGQMAKLSLGISV
ncbi:Hypothetical protein CAP_7777 [Chondromyces apiculatus DSM 436]|uniref:Uncharacterized protein n=1 Tax=Chondromyces apiculatus DSM 436 TaxID=1192034 RepID=A0A017SXV0_9BACT|nr:Hypothetical protein CAP_7777 [Chondromyces apiculatus DSM 436]